MNALREAPICAAAVAKLRAEGWRVVCEIPILYRTIDAVALRGDKVLALEAKTSFNKKLRCQLRSNQLIADFVLAVIGATPKESAMQWCDQERVGLWYVHGGVYECRPILQQSPFPHYRQSIIERMDLFDEAAAGGLPNLKGVGVAQEVQRGVDAYRAGNPNATWKEIFSNVPSHYRTAKNMYSALRSNAERLAFRQRVKERKLMNDI